ncbi:MAG: multifunctional CCA addition/repair protein [Magnetococcales bacterium]|nr:multifunctional CCA addition/repair protein [Magnetococcales bacterium]
MSSAQERSFQCYQVGGSVRDTILGIDSQDRDWVVVGQKPETLLALGYKQVGADFPVFLHPVSKEEYALARTERKTGPGYRGFKVQFGVEVTLEEDLIRRDLTINAMAIDNRGRIIDPFGGQNDLKKRILRHVSPAFVEDPLRVLRVARFLASFTPLGFQIAPETLTLMQQIANSGVLKELTPERIWIETEKALATTRPSIFFKTLKECGAIKDVFYELDNLAGQLQPELYHPEGDAWIHTLLSLDAAAQLSPNTEVRFAALMHDIGKSLTPGTALPHHYGHEDTGAKQLEDFCLRIKAPKSFSKLAILTAKYHMHCHRIAEMRPKRIVKLLNQLDGFRNPEIVTKFIIACTADKWGRGPERMNIPYRAGEQLKKCLDSCLNIDNRTIAEAGNHGKDFGEALHKLRIKKVSDVMVFSKNDNLH